jgi:hypothetical protein
MLTGASFLLDLNDLDLADLFDLDLDFYLLEIERTFAEWGLWYSHFSGP